MATTRLTTILHRAAAGLARLGFLVPVLMPITRAQLTGRQAGGQPPARCGHYAFFDEARGRVTLFGGQTTQSLYGADCWQLEDNDGIQISLMAPTARGYGAACEDTSGGVGLLFGGRDS